LQFTSEFTPAPDLEVSSSDAPFTRIKEASTGTESITPRASPKSSIPQIPPIVPQNTGEWRSALPSFRQSLLGGKSLNRFSSFVTSGAEEFVLKGTPADVVVSTEPFPDHRRDGSDATIDEESSRLSRLGMGEADRHFVDAGPAWKEKLPPFRVIVHSPSKRTSALSGSYTVYNVTSLFHSPSPEENENGDGDSNTEPDYSTPSVAPTITVHRRFSHFVILHRALTRRLPGIALPPLPEKQYAGRFSEDFVEARRGDLERYIGKVVRHPVARYAEVVTFFLGCESDAVSCQSIG
jgi:sorting nexin-9/18/33